MDENQNNNDLGLIDILQIMGQWVVAAFNKLVEWFLYLFYFGIKRWIILGAALLIIGVVTVISYKSQTAQYEATMMIRSNAVMASQMKPFIDNYSNLLDNKILSQESINEQTGLDRDQRAMIGDVTTYYCVDKNRDGVMESVDFAGKLKLSDENLDSLNLCVKVRFEDVEVLDEVVESLNFYLDNVPYLARMNKARLVQQASRKDFVLNEIRLLDTMQQRSFGVSDAANSLTRNGGVLVDNRKVLSIYEDKVQLWDQCEKLDKEIDFYTTPITVVEDFVIRESAINSLSTMLKTNLIYGFIIVYAFLFLFVFIYKEKDKYLKKI